MRFGIRRALLATHDDCDKRFAGNAFSAGGATLVAIPQRFSSRDTSKRKPGQRRILAQDTRNERLRVHLTRKFAPESSVAKCYRQGLETLLFAKDRSGQHNKTLLILSAAHGAPHTNHMWGPKFRAATAPVKYRRGTVDSIALLRSG